MRSAAPGTRTRPVPVPQNTTTEEGLPASDFDLPADRDLAAFNALFEYLLLLPTGQMAFLLGPAPRRRGRRPSRANALRWLFKQREVPEPTLDFDRRVEAVIPPSLLQATGWYDTRSDALGSAEQTANAERHVRVSSNLPPTPASVLPWERELLLPIVRAVLEQQPQVERVENTSP